MQTLKELTKRIKNFEKQQEVSKMETEEASPKEKKKSARFARTFSSRAARFARKNERA